MSSSGLLVSQGGQNLPAPVLGADTPEESSNKLTTFLHKLAGYTDEEVNAILKEHCYARPWNWRPENIYVKPTKKIFFSRKPELIRDKSIQGDVIDVVNVDAPEELSLPCDLTKARQCTEELEKLASFARPDDSNDDWEEKIEKTFWSPVQRRIFSHIFTIINSERLNRLAKLDDQLELVYRRTSVDSSAKRFREVMASIGWDHRIVQWLHGLFMDNLSRDGLVIYFDILQTLRAKIPQLVDRMIAPVPNAVVKPGSIPLESLNAVLKRSWDPLAICMNNNRPKKLPGNPILIVVPSGINNVSPRQHKWITQLGALGMLVTVHSHLGLAANKMTMMTCLEQLVQATRAKVQDMRSDCPGRPIILVGFNSGAALACQVALLEHVTAVICLGFPFATVEGKRGLPEDTLMDIRCPIMFIIGQTATLVRPDDLENIREKMLVESTLVVVGTADDSLRISTSKKITEGITQSMVDRCIMDEIADFIGGILLQPHPLPLRPAGLLNLDKNKRETRKRKISTSSSVDSESNFPNVQKKPRPVSGTNNVAHNSVPRRKSKMMNSQKVNPDQLLSRQTVQLNSNPSNGITLNIGSMASLSPVGPIRLPAGPANQPNNPVKSNFNSNSKTPLSFSKVPKMIQPNNQQNLTGKLKTIAPTNKPLSKTVPGNYKPMEKSEAKLVTVLTSNGNQVRVATPTSGVINKSGTGGTLTALLHSRKNSSDNLSEGRVTNTSVSINSSGFNTSTATITSTTAKAMECVGQGANLNINNSLSITRVDDSTAANNSNNSITILPWSSKIKNSFKNDSDLPKITPVGNKNPWEKTNHQQSTSSLNKNPPLEIDDDDLGNILDIPIIFAKDDDNLNAIEKSPISLPLTTSSDTGQQKINKINPTKVVLLSNKEGKVYHRPTKATPTNKTDQEQSQQDSLVNRVIFQRRMQNSTMSSVNWNNAPRNQTSATQSGANQPPMKYTKIILSKRQNPSTLTTNYTDQVVLTKNTPRKRLSSQTIAGDKNQPGFAGASTPVKMISGSEDKCSNDGDNNDNNTVQTETSDCKLFDDSDI
ncbi:KAT8 regulatory NSL complex subunit 3 [Microplitis mediator]|uniref:KAT8 regulatory NSL complex subunit 3 n=1 Tax=Microplitis mediator TaxID=375433 RepID=UPI002557512E|nr:KAT8 regulatory NSL complex subunit 3 [Microplitis mediator]XP_057339744.1 KAT8 regulatory NSL complex subunit 3 [Microplitis mediator]